MFTKIFTVTALASCVLGQILNEPFESLNGVHGGNRVTLCMDPGRKKDECPGVIWQRHWVLAQGTCIANRPLYSVIILRTTAADCETMLPDEKVKDSRKIHARFLHTSFPDTDVGLVCLDRPYDALDPVQNDSIATLNKFEPWLSETFNQYTITTPRAQSIHEHRDMLFSSPVKMFVTTVVLPLTSFIVFFLFVTFFTGSNKSTVSYRSLPNDKEDKSFA